MYLFSVPNEVIIKLIQKAEPYTIETEFEETLKNKGIKYNLITDPKKLKNGELILIITPGNMIHLVAFRDWSKCDDIAGRCKRQCPGRLVSTEFDYPLCLGYDVQDWKTGKILTKFLMAKLDPASELDVALKYML